MSSYLSTIAWLHKTFTNRQRTAELLRPELDEHVLSPHDYELATRFLPGPRINWQLIYGVGASGAVYGYGSYLSRPKWNTWRVRLGSLAAFLVGSTYGTFSQLVLHYRFANSLDNPQGFILALNHIDERLGGSGQIGFAFREMLAKKSEIKFDLDRASHPPQDTVTVAEEGWIRDHDNLNGSISRADPSGLRSRWDEVRAANTRNAGQSSWDTIRQRHERSKLPDSNTGNSSPVDEADERAAAKAKFDALVEAERRRGQPHDDQE